jgi:hypothetical protein
MEGRINLLCAGMSFGASIVIAINEGILNTGFFLFFMITLYELRIWSLKEN